MPEGRMGKMEDMRELKRIRKAKGITVDAWFTGFADTADGRIYFCVYLGETEGREVTSAGAREIAMKLIDSMA